MINFPANNKSEREWYIYYENYGLQTKLQDVVRSLLTFGTLHIASIPIITRSTNAPRLTDSWWFASSKGPSLTLWMLTTNRFSWRFPAHLKLNKGLVNSQKALFLQRSAVFNTVHRVILRWSKDRVTITWISMSDLYKKSLFFRIYCSDIEGALWSWETNLPCFLIAVEIGI